MEGLQVSELVSECCGGGELYMLCICMMVVLAQHLVRRTWMRRMRPEPARDPQSRATEQLWVGDNTC